MPRSGAAPQPKAERGARLSFSSVAFLIYFLPVTAAIFFALGFSRQAQNAWLFLAGLVFCAWGDPATAVALLVSVFACTAFGLAAERAQESGRRRARTVTALGCAFPLGLLFLVRCLPALLSGLPWAAAETGAVLPFMRPVGIAFFTLQALSYLLDVSRGEAAAERNPVSVGLSVAFFPRLLAGPILRHAEIAPQLRERRTDFAAFADGVCRFVLGFGKVTMIAYPLRQAADYVFALSAVREGADGSESISVALAWLGVIAYALQLYHGFSGYTDMAVGLSRMFGFTARENFDHPYAARSVTEFWRRWHISLSDWFRIYIWPPFDGRGAGADSNADGGRAARNSLAVWLCIGLWHGAALTYIIWAFWHFFWLTVERVTAFDRRSVPGLLRRLYVWIAVGVGWIFFRAHSAADAFSYLRTALGLSRNAFAGSAVLMLLREYWPAFLLALLLSAPLSRFGDAVLPKALAEIFRVLALAVFLFGGLICLVRAGAVIWV
jgi:alginate O-acetyltransferase complex protein AlgI